MKKDVSICFRTSSSIRATLSKLADKERVSVSNVIESIIYGHLKTLRDIEGIEQDRRRFERKKVVLPAFVGAAQANIQEFETGKVLDLSLNGIRFSVPKGTKLDIQADGKNAEFSIIFTLSNEPRPVKVKCRSTQVYDYAEEVQVGAAFVDYDFNASQAIQHYIN
jgi:hypothetical protein